MPINMRIGQAVGSLASDLGAALPGRPVKSMDAWTLVQIAPLFSGVLPDDYRRISAVARVQGFALREMLYLEGDAVERVLIVTSGLVKTSQRGPGGTEVALRVGGTWDVLGAVSLFTSGRHTTTAQALRMGYAVVWEAPVFKSSAASLPVVQQNIIRLAGEHLQELEQRFLELATQRVEPDGPEPISLAEMEKRLITATLRRTGGHVRDSAAILGIDRSTLYEKIRKYAIPR